MVIYYFSFTSFFRLESKNTDESNDRDQLDSIDRGNELSQTLQNHNLLIALQSGNAPSHFTMQVK